MLRTLRRQPLPRPRHRSSSATPVEGLEPRTLMAVTLVADLVPGPNGSTIRDVVSFNDRAYFTVPPTNFPQGEPQAGIWRTGPGGSGVNVVAPGFFAFPSVSNGDLWMAARPADDQST